MQSELTVKPASQGRIKFLVGGILIIAAVVYLIVSSTQASAQYFLTIDELKAKGASIVGQDVRISGAVLGDTIQYDSQNLNLTFEFANVPGDNKVIDEQGGLAAVLHAAVENPNATRLQIQYNGVQPDLLRHEAQAIVTGKLGEDGVFHASELLLKCPTKYEDAAPNQVDSSAAAK
jgi:cytochrome c-type biogenesis protein CcmE